MADPNQGLFDDFGLSGLTAEEQRLAKGRASAEVNRAQSQDRLAGLGQASQIAGGVGQALAQRFGRNPKLTEEETRRTTAVQKAQERMKAAQAANPKLANLSGEVQQNVFQKLLAEELGNAGEVQLGLQVNAQLEQKRREQQAQKLELRKLGIGVDRESLARDRDARIAEGDDLRLDEARRGKMTQIYIPGSTDPNSGQAAFIKPDGTAVDAGTGEEIAPGQYSIVRPLAGKEGKTRSERVREIITPSQQAKLRAQQRAIVQQINAAETMKQALEDSIAEDGSINIMDGAGSATVATTKVIDLFSALGRSINGSVTLTDAEGNSIGAGQLDQSGAANRYVKNNATELNGLLGDAVPAEIRNNQRARERFYSALVQMAYAQARAQEPGARQLSDADFKNALAGLAGATSDPETFREVMLSSIQRNVADFSLWRKQVGDEVYNEVIGGGATDEFNQRLEALNESFNTGSFGTAANPGPGLTGQPAQQGAAPLTSAPPGQPVQAGGATITFLD